MLILNVSRGGRNLVLGQTTDSDGGEVTEIIVSELKTFGRI